MTEPGLISVRTELVKEVLVGRIAERAAALEHRVSPEAETWLEAGLHPEEGPDPVAEACARAGYATRLAELELFEPARGPASWLADALGERVAAGEEWPSAAAAVSRELALQEPLERPDPDDERAVSWRLPGPGGHVRHYVAVRALAKRNAAAELKRDFVYGLLLRCCEEVRPR